MKRSALPVSLSTRIKYKESVAIHICKYIFNFNIIRRQKLLERIQVVSEILLGVSFVEPFLPLIIGMVWRRSFAVDPLKNDPRWDNASHHFGSGGTLGYNPNYKYGR